MQVSEEKKLDLLTLIKEDLDQLDTVPSLDGEEYTNRHKDFESATNQRSLIVEWFKTNFSKPRDEFSVLSPGCGSGCVDKSLIENFLDSTKKLNYLGIDTNKAQVESFNNSFSAFNKEGIEIKCELACLKEFQANQEFNLIHAIQVVFYIPDLEGTIKKLYSMLKKGGTLVIVNAPNEDLCKISNLIWTKQFDHEPWFSEHIEKELKKQDIPFERERIEAKLKLEDKVLDFAAQSKLDLLPENLKANITKYFDEISKGDNEKYLEHPVDVFKITKS